LLTFLQMSPLNMNLHQHHHFPDGSIQHKKQLVILSVILQINVIHIHSSSEPPLFWLKFQRLMIQKHLQKLLCHPDWDTTMNEEYHSLMVNDTWDLVPLLKGRKLVRCKWVYRTKYASDGSVERHKAQLVSKGFSQVEGIDYNETFSPIAKMNSIHLVLALVASHKWEVHQMDVKSIPSCMGIYKNKSTWNNLLAMFRMTPTLFVTLRNLSMVLSKLLSLVC
jgi:hypothetical protein